jgi:hypothetical protein
MDFMGDREMIQPESDRNYFETKPRRIGTITLGEDDEPIVGFCLSRHFQYSQHCSNQNGPALSIQEDWPQRAGMPTFIRITDIRIAPRISLRRIPEKFFYEFNKLVPHVPKRG